MNETTYSILLYLKLNVNILFDVVIYYNNKLQFFLCCFLGDCWIKIGTI